MQQVSLIESDGDSGCYHGQLERVLDDLTISLVGQDGQTFGRDERKSALGHKERRVLLYSSSAFKDKVAKRVVEQRTPESKHSEWWQRREERGVDEEGRAREGEGRRLFFFSLAKPRSKTNSQSLRTFAQRTLSSTRLCLPWCHQHELFDCTPTRHDTHTLSHTLTLSAMDTSNRVSDNPCPLCGGTVSVCWINMTERFIMCKNLDVSVS